MKEKVVTFTFNGPFSHPVVEYYRGFTSMTEAEAFGYVRACELSAGAHVPIHLSNVVMDDQNFICVTLPYKGRYKNIQNVTTLATSDKIISIDVRRRDLRVYRIKASSEAEAYSFSRIIFDSMSDRNEYELSDPKENLDGTWTFNIEKIT